MITFAALFGLYAAVEYLKGSGAMAALIFGFVLSNSREITRIFKMKTEFVIDDKIRQFHSEITFFIRTFFFVYLGLMFTFPEVYDTSFWIFISVSLLIFLVILVSRYGIVNTLVLIRPEHKKDKNIIWVMLPRGLAAAVLAAMVVAEGIPKTDQFMNFAFIIIVLTVSATTIGTYLTQRDTHKKKSKLKRAEI
jgi:cell volume regulation protein A